MKKIAFLMRYNYLEVGGGDVQQVTSYIPYFRSKGYECELVKDLDSSNVLNFDIFIIVNIDRPIETLNYFNFLRNSVPDKKVFIIPIHHPIDAVSRFEKQEKGLVFSLLCTIFPDFYTREKFKNFVRGIRYKKLIPLAFKHVFVNYRLATKKILQSVDGVIYISNGERVSVESDFDCTPKNYCIAYNAVDTDFSKKIEIDRKFDVVVVGRIEPRKNQLNVVNALASIPVAAIIIGPTSESNKQYNINFMNAVDRSSNIQYLGAMDHLDVLSYLTNSKVLLNASYFEVNPLVDLEAALCGCGVVTTKFSYSKESLPNVIEIDPWLNNSIMEGIVKALQFPEKTICDMKINSSWDSSAQKIMELISK